MSDIVRRHVKVINDAIHGDFSIGGVREELLATPEVNKLSHIKQLGLALEAEEHVADLEEEALLFQVHERG